jgi:hypothetical protein
MKRFNWSTRNKLIAAASIAVGGSLVGVAIAAWTSGGSGSGQASAGSAATLTITAGSPTSSLYPNGSADVAATISNPNPYKVHIGSVSLGTVTVDGGHSGCNAGSSVTVTSPQTNGGSGWDVPAKSGGTNGSVNVDLANAISMDNNANDACQGATFTVALTATGASTP